MSGTSFQRKNNKPSEVSVNGEQGGQGKGKRRYRKRALPPTYDNVARYNEIQINNETKRYSEVDAAIAVRLDADFDRYEHTSIDSITMSWKRFYQWSKENELIDSNVL